MGLIDRCIHRYLMFHAQSTAKGLIRANQNVFLPQVEIMIHYFQTHSTLRRCSQTAIVVFYDTRSESSGKL